MELEVTKVVVTERGVEFTFWTVATMDPTESEWVQGVRSPVREFGTKSFSLGFRQSLLLVPGVWVPKEWVTETRPTPDGLERRLKAKGRTVTETNRLRGSRVTLQTFLLVTKSEKEIYDTEGYSRRKESFC